MFIRHPQRKSGGYQIFKVDEQPDVPALLQPVLHDESTTEFRQGAGKLHESKLLALKRHLLTLSGDLHRFMGICSFCRLS